jgi:predicted type IV restriction endonuclease
MTVTVGIAENIKSLNDLQAKFNLRQTEDDEFFTECFEDLPELSDTEKVALSSIRQRYVYHRNDGPLLEGTVNLVVVSPLLTVAGFLDPPFKIRSPESVEISIDDPDEIIKGLIDVLVVQEQLWIVVVASKRNTIPVTAALPQILAYMMAGLSGNEPIFGLVTNGDEFIFVKLCREGTARYDISDSFLLLPRRHKFQEVLLVLKRLGRLATD